MKIDITVPELVRVFKEIQRPEQLFTMIKSDLKEKIRKYLSKLMEA